LYGEPALAIAVNRYTEATASWHAGSNIKFKLLNLEYAASVTLHTLSKIKNRLQNDYHNFLNGNCSIRQVLTKPFELLQYSVSTLLEELNANLPKGLEIKVNSAIPIGCGMGSSAAAVVSTLHVISKMLNIEFEPKKFLSIGKKVENLQHGKSSGLDISLTTYGGCIKFTQGKIEFIKMPEFNLYMVNTGAPSTTTGECVSLAANIFAANESLSSNFGIVTEAMQKAINANNFVDFKYCIRENHQLLNYLGVVTDTVATFIRTIEQCGGAAKVCGAGSICGNGSGMVLVCIEDKNQLDIIANNYGFTVEAIQMDQYGTQII
jgi:mevalonate kinase